MKYFYIHGLNGTGNNATTQLSEILETTVERLEWDPHKPYNENYQNIKTVLDKESDFILMGSSLGGFYTLNLANDYKIPCAVFNPAINPKKSFKNIKDIDFYKNIPLNNLVDSYDFKTNYTTLPRLIVVGLNDKIVNPFDTIERWKGKCNLIQTNDEHQIKDFKPFKDAIKHLTTPLFAESIL